MARLAQVPAVGFGSRADRAPDQRIPRLRTRYYAFLSYSHKDRDLADWLHRELERFRVPNSLAGRLTANGVVPKRLTPIFRDQHDLSAGADLAEEIKAALAASQFLIVLCSPTAATSRWTNQEIESFKRTRPEGCVLAAIAAGEPFASEIAGHEGEECFPPALRYKFDRRGHQTSKKAEPLAADFRDGGDGRRTAVLKLVAGMLGVGLDDLVRREQTRRQRRLAWLASGSLAGMAVTSTLAAVAFQARNEAREQRKDAEGLVGFMLGDLKDKLEPIGRLDALDAVGSRALAYYQHQDKGSLSDAALAQRAKALTLLGEIAQTRGDTAGALKRYEEALASTAESVRRYPDDPQRIFDHAQNVFYVGAISYQRADLARTEAAWREYQRLADRMVELAPDKKDYRLEQVYANTDVGTVLMDQRRYREAASTFAQSVAGAQALAAAEPNNIDYQKRLSNNLAWIADADESAGRLDQALAVRERQLRLLDELERMDPRDTLVQRHKMTAHRAVGRLLGETGDVAGGLRELQAGVAISDALFRIEPDNTDWLQASANGRYDLADLQLSTGQIAEAAATTRSHCDIADRLLNRDSSVASWKSGLQARCLELRERIALAQKSSEEAFALAQQWVAAAQRAPAGSTRDLETMRALAAGGDALAAAGRRSEALSWWTSAARRTPRSVEFTPSEQATIAALELRIGDKPHSEAVVSSLAAMGYRHPDYLRRLKNRGESI